MDRGNNKELAALRGQPSQVWRAGQERRLQILAEWAMLEGGYVLIDGCGIGMYAAKIRERFMSNVEAFDIELERVAIARLSVPHAVVAAAEYLPYPNQFFDTVFSHEVIEHVADDRRAVWEMARVCKPGGRIVIFCPNRWYPFETHGHYWKGKYHFGNTPLVNYLPGPLRRRFVPHARAYTKRELAHLFDALPVKIIHHSRVYGGYDNLIARFGKPAQLVRDFLYNLERTPLDTWGLSHLLVVEKMRE